MREFEELDDGGADTVFRDVIMLTLAGFIVIVLLTRISHVTDPSDAVLV